MLGFFKKNVKYSVCTGAEQAIVVVRVPTTAKKAYYFSSHINDSNVRII